MNKRNLVVTILLACMLVGTVAFAETGSFRFGAGLVGFTYSEDTDLRALGYELTGRAWFAQLPQLTLNFSYSDLNWKHKDYDTKLGTINDIAVVAEYRLYNETKYGFSANTGWISRGFTSNVSNVEKEAVNYLTLGGKGNYVLADGLQAIAGVSYNFNNLFKEEDEKEIAFMMALRKVGSIFL